MTRHGNLRVACALVSLALVSGCRDHARPGEPVPPAPHHDATSIRQPAPATRMEGAFFMAEGAPSPLACTQDAECIVNSLPDAQGCCLDTSKVWVPQTTAYSYWHAQWQQRNCADTTCPPPPLPYPPEECRTAARCVDGRCTDSCGPAGDGD